MSTERRIGGGNERPSAVEPNADGVDGLPVEGTQVEVTREDRQGFVEITVKCGGREGGVHVNLKQGVTDVYIRFKEHAPEDDPDAHKIYTELLAQLRALKADDVIAEHTEAIGDVIGVSPEKQTEILEAAGFTGKEDGTGYSI